MRILILNWRDPMHPLAGGAEISLLEHAKYWQKKGAKITWFGSSFPDAKEKETIENMQIIRKGSHYTVHMWAYLYFLQKKLGGFDLVIDCFHFLPFFTPLYLKSEKIIAIIHEVAKDVWFKNLPWIFAVIGSNIEPYFFRLYKSNPFITVSDSTKNELNGLDIPESQIYVIHNGVRIPKSVKKYPKTSKPVILFLGRIAADKGIRDAIQAYENVFSEHNDVELWVAGKEEKKGTFNKLISKRKGKIKYFGFVSPDEKWELLQKAWVLIHPSTREGWGLTVIEANCMGTPVVGYDVPGLRDSIKDNRTGLLVHPSPDSLAKGIGRVLYEKGVLQEFSIAAKTWSKNFSWEKAGKESWSIINKKSLV